MTTATYPVHITIESRRGRKNPIQVTPELEEFIDFVMDEWEEREQDKKLRLALEADTELGAKIERMRKKLNS